MKQQKVFVTGANGFVGQATVKELASRHQVYALVRPGTVPRFKLTEQVFVVEGDLTDENSLRRVMPREAVVVNLAANPYHPTLSYEVNVRGVEKLLRVAKEKRVEKFIQMSSQATKIKKRGVYGKTKAAADQLVRKSGLKYAILKPSLIYGPGERGLFAKVRRMMRVVPAVPVFGNGSTKLNPIYVDDVAYYLRKVVEDSKVEAEEWELGSRRPITYNRLYRTIKGEQKTRLVHVPRIVGLLLAYCLRPLPHPPIVPDNVLGSTQETKCKPSPIIKRYHYSPRTFMEGVREMKGGKKIKVAVVGLGKMGTLHLALLSTFSEVEIAALVDTNPALFKTIQSMGVKGRFYRTLTEAIAQESLDAVYLTTPTFTHLPLLKEAVKAGLDIFVEKPAALNAAELKELGTMKTKQVIHVGYTLLYSRVFNELKRILVAEKYGKIVKVRATFAHGEVFGAKRGWMFNKQLSGGGVLMNPGPHFFSVLQLLFGKPRKIEATIREIYRPGLDDEVEAVLSYPNFEAKIRLSWSVPNQDVPQTKLVITCEKGNFECNGKKIVIKTAGGKRIINGEEISVPKEKIFNLNPQANGEAYYRENKRFLEAVGGSKKRAPNTLTKAVKIETTIAKVYRAAQIES